MTSVALRSSQRGVGSRDSGIRASTADVRLALVRDPLRTALFVLTVLTVSRVHEHYPMLARARPALLLVAASVGYAYLNPRYLTRANVLGLWPMRLVATLGVLACISVPFGLSLGASAMFILDSYVKTLAYAFLIAVSIRSVADLFTFVWAYVVGCGILAFFSIFVFGISREGNSYVTRLNHLYTYDSNDLCVVMMVGLPLTLLLLSVERGTKRWVLLTILTGISATIARSGSRGGFLGFLAIGAAGLVLVNSVSSGRRLMVAAAAFIVLVVGAPPGYWKQMGTILSPKEDYNYSDVDGRKAVMNRGFGYMMQYPVFGLGINNFARAECSISPKLANLRVNGPMKCSAPHNSYIEAGSELGFPGFFVWIFLVIGGVFAPLRLRRRLPKSWRRGTEYQRFIFNATSFFSVAMVGFAVTSFFVSFAWMDPVYLMAAFITGLYVATRLQIEEGSRTAGQPAPMITPRGAAGWRVRRSSAKADSAFGPDYNLAPSPV
ncbi:MAG TPA: O-antigen ligase family protein [Gemmatimonadaceae bacterium]